MKSECVAGKLDEDLDALPKEVGPQRTCIVTRTEADPEELIRFVVGPDGRLVPDVARKLPGRGAWVGCARGSLAKAIGRRQFARAFRRQVIVDAGLLDLVDALLQSRVVASLSMANKAGFVVSGFVKVERLIDGGACAVLLHAAEAAADGVRKLDGKYEAMCREVERRACVVNALGSRDLGLAIGRENVIHVGMKDGGAAREFARNAVRLLKYRSS